MYSSGYSQVHKYSPKAQKKMPHRSKGKSCGYYMRVVFFFSSLIQTLIIVSLVLFLVYGNKEDTASTSRIQDLERSFSQLSIENVALRQQRKNLTNVLNVTLTEKARIDLDRMKYHILIKNSIPVIQDLQKRNQQCNNDLLFCKLTTSGVGPPILPNGCNRGVLVEQLKARLQLVESNFTHTVQKMRIEVDQTVKERDDLTLDTIQLRRDKSILEKELELYQHKIKDDFSHHLSSVSNVSKAFLQKIDSLFPAHIPFQLTCSKQREHLEQIRTNCTSLSREVEDKLQGYLNVVGSKVSDIQAENNRLIAENWRLSDDYRWCSQNRSGLIREHRMNLDKLQAKHDKDKEKLLMDKLRLNGEIDVLTNNVKFKTKEVDHLKEQVRNLNMSCVSKGGFGVSTSRGYTPPQTGWNALGGGGSSLGSSSSASGASRAGSVSLGSSVGSFGSFNKPLSTGTSSSPGSNPGLSSTGTGFNKPISTGTGSSGSTFSSAGSNPGLSSTGSLFNKPVSTRTGSSSSAFSSAGSNPGLSSTGSGFNKPISTGTGSSSSSVLSPGSSPGLGSSGSGGIKPPSTGTGYSSSSSSTGSSPNLGSAGSEVNKPVSTGGIFSGLGSTGLSSSGTGLNKPVVTARGTSTSSSSSSSSYSSSSSSSSSSGSVGPNPNLSSNSNKPATSVKSSPGLGPSVGSGSTSRTSSISGLSWFGFGNSNSGQSKAGSATGKESGTSQSGTGSSFGAGRTNGLAGGTINVAQHLQELQRIINPPGPEEKQDLSRMLG